MPNSVPGRGPQDYSEPQQLRNSELNAGLGCEGLHPYRCFFCGMTLIEVGLGIIYCRACDRNFVPSIDDAGNPTLTAEPEAT